MSERHALRSSSTFECVDKDLDSVPGSSGQTHGGIFMHVESRCGTHLCPPYTDGKELTCVVCSKMILKIVCITCSIGSFV